MKQGKFRHFLQIIWINSRGFTEKTEGYFLERLIKRAVSPSSSWWSLRKNVEEKSE